MNYQNVFKLPLKTFAINLSPQNSPKLVLSIKKGQKKTLLADNDPFVREGMEITSLIRQLLPLQECVRVMYVRLNNKFEW